MIQNNKTAFTILSDGLDGGAAQATSNLEKGLRRDGVETSRWHFTPEKQNHPQHYISLDRGRKRPPFERIIKNFNKNLANYLRVKRHILAFKNAIVQRSPKLLNIHNIHNSGISHLNIPENLPIIWTMHDCWAFDQHAFAWTDQNGCKCHAVKDKNSVISKVKVDTLKRIKNNLILVAPSKWLANLAKEKTHGEVRIEHIPYGVDTDLFSPKDKNLARKELGLPPKKMWLGSASTWSNSRKGFDILAKALNQIDCSDIGLLAWGAQPKDPLPSELTVKFSGTISGAERLSTNYSACDAFICPSRADNLPNTVLESLSCGIPVIGSDTGGIPDMIRENFNGLIFKSNDPENCKAKVKEAEMKIGNFSDLRNSIRNRVLSDFSIKRQAELYLNIIPQVTY